MTATHQEALETLGRHPECTDAAVRKLERLSRDEAGASASASVWSDLSASYYVRAQRKNQPLDLLRALDAADHAVAIAPPLAEARFNQALAQEALGLAAALTSWDQLRKNGSSSWTVEARQHWRRLDRDVARQAATEWPLTRQRIAPAVADGDRTAVIRLTATHIVAAQRFVEEELLPQWARASSADEGREPLAVARAVAGAIQRASGDGYLVDTVSLIERAEGTPMADTLREGHLALAAGREGDHAYNGLRSLPEYERAEQAFRNAGSPMRLGAQLGLAIALTRTFKPADRVRATTIVEDVERKARALGYRNVLGRAQSNRGFILFLNSRYLESLAQYDAALATFRRLNDGEGLANGHVREIGLYRILGQKDLAWREAFSAKRYAKYMIDAGSRHHLLGELAATSLASGYPRIALLYQNDAIRLIEDDLATVSPTDKATINGLRTNLAIALRARAGIWLHYKPHEQYDAARHDLIEAIRLANSEATSDTNIRQALLARVEELKGLAASCGDPHAAIQAFTRALDLSSPNEYRTFRAALLAERAEAHRCAGEHDAAESDLRTAIDELHAEEKGILVHRKRGEGEALWSGYFSRFQDTYRRLIRLSSEKDADEAFAYAEEARAFEPLDLLLDSPTVPEAFRKLVRDGETLSRARVQEQLPGGTFLIEFCVLEDRTFVWIVSHDDFELLSEPVSRSTIENWSQTLRNAALSRDVAKFKAGLEAPFAALLSTPLARIQRLSDGRSPVQRLVFVPDGAIHGIPLGALRNPSSKRYLIEDYPVAVAASATLYVFSRIRDKALTSAEAPSILLVGDPAFRNEPGFPPGLARLREARSEVERIRQLYGPAATMLPGKEATVPAFLDLARNHTIVHFAGHALVNSESPFRSMLVLAPSSHRSGALDVEELLTELELQKTRLFVLSTCSGAGGVDIGPDGLAPLLRPIVAAGVPGTVGSLWDVGSAATEELLVQFHRYYHDGNDADRALQLAQLNLMKRKEAGLKTVLAWAPFEVIGHASSPFAPKTR